MPSLSALPENMALSSSVALLDELEQICNLVAKEFPRTIFLSGKLVFEKENIFTRLRHNHTPNTL